MVKWFEDWGENVKNEGSYVGSLVKWLEDWGEEVKNEGSNPAVSMFFSFTNRLFKVCPESNHSCFLDYQAGRAIDLGIINCHASLHSKSRYHHREITVDVAKAAGL